MRSARKRIDHFRITQLAVAVRLGMPCPSQQIPVVQGSWVNETLSRGVTGRDSCVAAKVGGEDT